MIESVGGRGRVAGGIVSQRRKVVQGILGHLQAAVAVVLEAGRMPQRIGHRLQ